MYVFPQEDVRIDVCISTGDTGLQWSNGCIASPTTLIPRNKEIEVG